MARLTILLALLALLAPAGALAQDNPFGPIPPAPPQQTAPPEGEETESPFADQDEGLSDRQQLLIVLAGGIFVVGIAWFILRDANRTAPVEHHRTAEEGGTASKGTRPPKKQRVSQSRAKAKQARQARKRNR
jgi:hypothetical protein